MSGSPAVPAFGKHRSRPRSPPTSLPAHFARKGYLSVSDLVGPSWCEYNYQYGILSLSHLPPTQRPATITTESGQTLAPSAQLVLKKESTLQAGKAVHSILEREVAPVQVVVETETREDGWALRLLNLWCDVQGLLQLSGNSKGKGKGKALGCVREIAVYGWVQGVLVMGVIDEIEKRPVELGRKEERGKTWASQEEWKKAQRKPPSPKKSNSSSSKPLTSFFGSQSKTPEPHVPKPQDPDPGWAYYLSDTKTRISSWLPAEEDQLSARMQCMTYKRLFDGLLLGAISSSNMDASLSFDPNTTPMDWTQTFTWLNLDPRQPLSGAFLRDAEPLCQSWGLDLGLFAATNDADVCTLHHMRLLLEQGLRELLEDAIRGQRRNDRQAEGKVGVIQDRLALTYRRQKQRRRGKRKKMAPERGIEQGDELRQLTLQASLTADVEAIDKGDLDQIQPTLLTNDETTVRTRETQKSLDALEGHNDALDAIEAALSSPPRTPRRKSNPAPTTPTTRSPLADPPSPTSSIIGVVHFTHDPSALDAYLGGMIRMWRGERALQGVGVDQTRRCWTCEWMDGCEWRSHQADLRHRPKVELQIELNEVGEKEGEEEEEEEGGGEEFWSTVDYDLIQVRDSLGNLVDW